MTRYAPDHKAKTRAHIIETARAEFRKRGFDVASIETLMRAAGLTRGGFYAHFESKEALVREILAIDAGLTEQLRQAAHGEDPGAEAATAFDDYLDPEQREGLVHCPMVAHPMDAKRGGSDRAALYTRQISSLTRALEEILGRNDDEPAVMVAMAVGAAVLGSVIADDSLAGRIEHAVRKELRQRLGASDAAHATASAKPERVD